MICLENGHKRFFILPIIQENLGLYLLVIVSQGLTFLQTHPR